ncbi:unnamed protein product, partial [Rotaria sp. Silwood1]
DPKDSIVVRLLSWPSEEQFEQQIRLADEVEAKPELLNENWKRIPSGDWLQRNLC